MTQPYTYVIGWTYIDIPRFYFGVRTANALAPREDLWHCYKTSSRKLVPQFAARYGDPDVMWVYPHETVEAALQDEDEFIKHWIRFGDRSIWLNRNYRGTPIGGWNKGIQSPRRGKTRAPHTAESKARISAAKRGKKLGPMSSQQRENISRAKKGKPVPALCGNQNARKHV